jgi:exonuclease SbcD
MKILHTSDWHVGKLLRGASRLNEYVAVLTEIAGIVESEDADLVIVAGDVFDTKNPAPEAERLVYSTLQRIARHCPVVVIAGNHDHPGKWGAVRGLLDLANVTVAASVVAPSKGGTIRVETKAGPANVALVPWLSQRGIVSADDLMDYDRDANASAYTDRLGRILRALAGKFVEGEVNVMTAHLTVVDKTGQVILGGGERKAHTVFDYCVDSTVFPASAQYVALGHVHHAQDLSAKTPVRYCGAPMHLDFSDTPNDKSVSIVEVEPGNAAAVRIVPIKAGRRLVTLKGTLTECEAQAAKWTATDGPGAWFRVMLDEPRRAGLAEEVRARIPEAVDIRPRDAEGDTDSGSNVLDDADANPIDLFTEFCTERGIEDPRVVKLFGELYDEVTSVGEEAAEAADLAQAS